MKMLKFDAVVGNPPYQQITGGGSEKAVAAVQAKPIFHLFVETGKRLDAKYLSMIIPARWYSGGIGLNEFRDAMLNDNRISHLYDYPNSRDCFTTADIAGGICYFLRGPGSVRKCFVTNVTNVEKTTVERSLADSGDIFIRNNKAFSIITKIKEHAHEYVDSCVLPIDAFGFPSKARGKEKSFVNAIKLVHSKGIGYVRRSEVKKNADLIDRYKVTIGILVPCNGEVGIDPRKGYKSITTPKILEPGEVTTFSYLVIGTFATRKEAENFKEYMKCKLPRFMLRQTLSSMHISKQNFMFVPLMDCRKSWNDKQIYDFFGLTDEERSIVESTMRDINE